jgi:hypothetical protein
MSNYFDGIHQTEFDQLKEAVPLIVVLIAGADGEIDTKEREWAKKIAKIRTYSGPEVLQDYYEEIGETFVARLNSLINELPKAAAERNKIISERLSTLNPILSKLDQTLGAILLNSFKSLASHVAQASGGFLRMWSVSKEESKWIALPMLDDIDFPDSYDEEE